MDRKKRRLIQNQQNVKGKTWPHWSLGDVRFVGCSCRCNRFRVYVDGRRSSRQLTPRIVSKNNWAPHTINIAVHKAKSHQWPLIDTVKFWLRAITGTINTLRAGRRMAWIYVGDAFDNGRLWSNALRVFTKTTLMIGSHNWPAGIVSTLGMILLGKIDLG